jgi:hypothetical protein
MTPVPALTPLANPEGDVALRCGDDDDGMFPQSVASATSFFPYDIYRNIDDLRNAVHDFVDRYNVQWMVVKNSYPSPAQARQAWSDAMSLKAAARDKLVPGKPGAIHL